MKTVKQLNEELDALRYEAKGIFESAERADRELNDDEKKRFDEITDKKSGLIAQLKKQLSEAEERERAILEVSIREQRQRSLEAIDGDLNTTRQPHTLPVNGRPPEEQRDDSGRVYVRAARLKAFKNERDAYDAGMWFRALIAREYRRDDKRADMHCLSRGLAFSTASTEGSGSSGGYLVPAPLSQTIIDVREAVGIARQVCQIQPMGSDTLSIPRRDGGLTVYYPGEASSITTSDKTWGQVELVVKKRAVAHQISQELQDDALISIVDNAVNEMAYALADKEDSEFIDGDGTSTYGGVLGLKSAIGSAGVHTAETGDSTWGLLDINDFTNTVGLLPGKYHVGQQTAWIASSNFYYTAMVRVMAEAGGNAISDLQAGDGAPRFLGRPVFFTDKMPTSTAVSTISAFYGSFSMGCILGDRMGIRIGRSDDFAFLDDLLTLKATARYDIQLHAPGDATNAGAFVALKTAAS